MSKSVGKLVGVYLGKMKGEGKTLVQSAELVAQHGMRGDCHAGRHPRRQVSLFAGEVFDELRASGFEVAPEELSANLLTAEIDLNSLKPGERLRIGSTLLEIAEARKPCRSITRIDHRLPKFLFGKCGQLAIVLEGGTVNPGDLIEMLGDERQPELFS